MNNAGAPHTILITYTTISSRNLEKPHLDVPITIHDQETGQVGLETLVVQM